MARGFFQEVAMLRYLLPTGLSFLMVAVFTNPAPVWAGGDECELQCRAEAEAFLKECIKTGGENCEARMHERLQACIAERCEPPPPDPTCEEMCEAHANEVFHACIKNGGTEGHCAEKRAIALRECIANECEEPPPPPPTCEELCEKHAREAFHACLEAGNGEGDCQAVYEETLQRCLENECGEPPPPPPPPTCAEMCERHAREAQQACLEAGKGEDRCHLVYQEALQVCLKNECGEPPPPPPPGCEEICEGHAREAFHACLEAGNGEDFCHGVYKSALRECLETECGEPPPPPPPSCEDLCERHAKEVFHACLEEGLGEGHCMEMRARAFRDCVAGECEEPPPPPPTCEEMCERHADEVFEACVANDGGGDACWKIRMEALGACIAKECEEPPPPEPTCEELCEKAAKEARNACLEEGNDEEACGEVFRNTYRECLMAQCGEPPPPPSDCEVACKEKADAVFNACIEEGNGEGHCWELRQIALRNCIAQECQEPGPCDDGSVLTCRMIKPECPKGLIAAVQNGCWVCVNPETCEPPPPPEPTCKELCRRHSQEVFRGCIEDGGSEKHCAALAEEALHACLEDCPPEPPEPTCEDRCIRMAEDFEEKCLAEGTDPEICASQAEQRLMACLDLCEEPPPPPEPTCEEICAKLAREAIERCIADGGTERECAAKGEEVLENCIRERCKPEPPPPPLSCEERCERHAAEVFHGCLEAGISEEACKARAQEAFRNCVIECKPEPPPEPPCEVWCEEKAAKAFNACMEETDGNEGLCRERSQAVLRECLAACQPEPPEPPSCEDECAQRGREILQLCMASGGSEEECRRHASVLVSLCLEQCGGGDPCQDRCAASARLVLAGCSLGGLPGKQCEQMANTVLEGCLAGCEPPPTCEGRCRELYHRAIAECVAMGNSAEDCEAENADLLENCLAECNGEEPPAYGVRCNEAAEKMEEKCLAKGGDPEVCAEDSRRFFRECLGEHGEDEARGLSAQNAPFQPFMRGDLDNDGKRQLGDAVQVLQFIFVVGNTVACEDAVDVDDDGRATLKDVITLLLVIFGPGGLSMPPPWDAPGQDPTTDSLICYP